MRVTIDFETRSKIDLKQVGMYRYSEDPTTDIMCAAVKANGECTRIWVPDKFDHLTTAFDTALKSRRIDNRIFEAYLGVAHKVHAHNAQFERIMYDNVLRRDYPTFPAIPIKKWVCTAHLAAAYSLPRSLGDVAAVLGVSEQKDDEGSKIMMKMCKPLPSNYTNAGQFHEDPEDFAKLCRYCIQDVETEYAVDQALWALEDRELGIYYLDQEINDRGIQVDISAIDNLIDKIKNEKDKLLEEVEHITQGNLSSTQQVQATIDWLADNGFTVEDLKKDTVKNAIREAEDPDVVRLLEIRQSLSKTSVAKFNKMKKIASEDERIRGAFLIHGANTGRWSGKGVQPHNYPRKCYPDEIVDLILRSSNDFIKMMFGGPIEVASKCLRSMLIAGPGKTLFCSDYSSIEARVTAWLAGEEKDLAAFRAGKDIYKVAAEDIYHIPYDQIGDKSDERQIGKVSTLALGYQGWLGAFHSMAKIYGVVIDDEKAKDIILRWRDSHPNVVALWHGLETAAKMTIENKGVYSYGRIKFGIRNNFLHVRLPSDRFLSYYDPKIESKITPYGVEKDVVTYMGVDSTTYKWTRQNTYGGKLTENIVQAIACDLLRFSMLYVDYIGFPIVMHVHDEIVSEVPDSYGEKEFKTFNEAVKTVPPWAEGLPMSAEGWIGKRYRKD